MPYVRFNNKDWHVLGRECQDPECASSPPSLVYACKIDNKTGEAGAIKKYPSRQAAEFCTQNAFGWSRTEISEMVIIPLSEAKDRACKHSLARAKPGFFEGKNLS